MTCNADTKANFLLWYKDFFGFSAPVATCLYEEQLFAEQEDPCQD
jgi:hypothetical protein